MQLEKTRYLYKKGFTLVELLIVIALLAVLLVILFWAYPAQIGKANDAKRKEDLDKLRIALQEYYSDKHCFPQTLECGQPFFPYLEVIPCDPKAGKSYIYLPQTADCAQWFKIYTSLEEKVDPVIKLVGCEGGCGPDKKSNYGVSSTNVSVGEPLASPLPSVSPSSSPSPSACPIITSCFGKNCNATTQNLCPNVYFCNDNCSGRCTDESGEPIQEKQCR